ncbi:hypothetical protein BDZ94DRAFT_1215871 [Collybia nuda]|uniref:SET domain-containing protein n=1 Tax=Collybia nuda TaxID=64659 RepID=A0A9P5YA79_9AGAR|nr:hypothetical protein BDZ94DRAFT_1215871 [Collybia nuda]
MSPDHPCWNYLLEWLVKHGMDTSSRNLKVEVRETSRAGYGLFALCDIAPSSSLFTIPATALLNVSTLSPHYPPIQPPLTAVQLLSLHLLRFRPKTSQRSLDPLFGPYISILPGHFDSHPLTWLWKKTKQPFGANLYLRLICDIPPSVLLSLTHVFDRFQSDWETICQYLSKHHDVFPRKFELLESDFLWAWLNVNTRCVYHQLMPSQSHSDNLTLCPILDFANHTTGKIRMTTLSQAHEGFRNIIGGNFTLLTPSSIVTQEHDELYLMYGAHSNRKLFVDYGFVNRTLDGGGEVDIQEPIQALFTGRGDLGKWMKYQLVESGYWGDWTLHSYPPPAHPSYRVIMALRLYHVFPPTSDQVPPDANDIILPWVYVLQGKQDFLSEENENAWRRTLLQLSDRLASRAILMTTEAFSDDNENGPEWFREMREAIRFLWEEELHVASGVSASIIQGLQF